MSLVTAADSAASRPYDRLVEVTWCEDDLDDAAGGWALPELATGSKKMGKKLSSRLLPFASKGSTSIAAVAEVRTVLGLREIAKMLIVVRLFDASALPSAPTA